MSWDALERAKANAVKILGKDAKIPKEKVDFDKLFDTSDKEVAAFKKLREDMEAQILKSENAISALSNAGKQTAAIFEKDDFGLDSKKKEDAKKIKQAQQIFASLFSQFQASYIKASEKNLEELDKHLIQMGKYKAPTP